MLRVEKNILFVKILNFISILSLKTDLSLTSSDFEPNSLTDCSRTPFMTLKVGTNREFEKLKHISLLNNLEIMVILIQFNRSEMFNLKHMLQVGTRSIA